MATEIYKYPDGTVYEGEWQGSKREGYGTWTRPDGMQYEGQWLNDKPEGHGTITASDGSSYTGEWKQGKRHGRGVFTNVKGVRQVGQWREGKLVEGGVQVEGEAEDCRELAQTNVALKQRIAKLEGDNQGEKRSRISFGYLKKFNTVMGFLHLIQGGLMLFFALTIEQFSDFRIPIMSYFLKFDTQAMRLVTNPDMLGEFPFAMFTSFFLLLSAFAHFIIIMPKTNLVYNRDLEKGINKFRWHEYSLSSSLMIILIAMLFGVYDIGALIAIFVLNASMNWFGLLMEQLNQYTGKTNWSPFVFGSIAGIGPWVIIIMHALGNADPAEVPWFVYAIIGSYFVFFNLFPINMILQYKKVGRWKDYFYGERGYIILSLVAKSVLAWLVFAGVMQP